MDDVKTGELKCKDAYEWRRVRTLHVTFSVIVSEKTTEPARPVDQLAVLVETLLREGWRHRASSDPLIAGLRIGLRSTEEV